MMGLLEDTSQESKPKVPLCEEQQQALEQIRAGFEDRRPIILTGRAGSGKSQVIKALKQDFPGEAAFSATTAKAALLIGGTTVDRLFGFSRDDWRIRNTGRLYDTMSQLPRTLVVDEASMAGQRMYQILYDIAVEYKKQLVLVGDWAQAMPVKDDWPFGLPAFEASHVIKLTQCHRQNEMDYLTALEHVRLGCLSQEVVNVFWPKVQAIPEDTHDEIVRMYATNQRVDDYNQRRLRAHVDTTQSHSDVLISTVTDNRTFSLREKYPMTERQRDGYLDSAMTAHNEPVALGCRVMVTMNNGSCVNGDTGVLKDILYGKKDDPPRTRRENVTAGKPALRLSEADDAVHDMDDYLPVAAVVELDRKLGDSTLTATVYEVEQEVKDAKGSAEVIIRGLPLRLGYAMTIHKSQGTTVARAHVDMLSLRSIPASGRHGLAYVALSRTSTLDGLTLSGLDHDMIRCDTAVRESGLL